MLTVIIFIIVLAVLIFVHELGHFLAARKNGVRVEEFGLGFPPRIFGIKKGETVYSLNMIPLGGFVKIFGEEGEGKGDSRSFVSKKIWRRTIILLAGVSMNVLLAAAIISLGFGIGLPEIIDDNQNVGGAQVQITQVTPNSPAQTAGIKTGDVLVKIVGQGELNDISRVSAVQNFISENKGKEIIVSLQRGNDIREVKILARVSPPSNEGPLGVGLARVVKVFYPWYLAIYEGIKTTFILIFTIVVGLGYLLWQLVSQGRAPGAEVAGPVGIFNLTGQAAQLGFIYLLQLTALLSVNLAIINALPFPALDGGRVLFLIIEKIKGSPVSEKIEKAIHSAGFALLILLMALITVRDVIKLF